MGFFNLVLRLTPQIADNPSSGDCRNHYPLIHINQGMVVNDIRKTDNKAFHRIANAPGELCVTHFFNS